MFIAGTVPLYGISRLSLYLLVTGLESHVPHIAKGALYYVVGIRVGTDLLKTSLLSRLGKGHREAIAGKPIFCHHT